MFSIFKTNQLLQTFQITSEFVYKSMYVPTKEIKELEKPIITLILIEKRLHFLAMNKWCMILAKI